MKLLEKDIEDVFEVYHKELIAEDLKFIARQHILDNKLRVDLLFKDGEGKNVVIEIKKDSITREDVGQTLQYAGMIKNSRVILIAPVIASSIKKAFDHYGIEYREFNPFEIAKLHEKMDLLPKKSPGKVRIEIPENIIKAPLISDKKRDGNIAFKVTYVDTNWNGVCSDKLFFTNSFSSEKKTWCSIQAKDKINCRSIEYLDPDNLDEDFFPCWDSVVLKTFNFSPGMTHGPVKINLPKRCLNAKVGKLAIFTSREPGEIENNRFIFSIAEIEQIAPAHKKDAEVFYCKKDTALIFNNRPLFWDYYKNPNVPEKASWHTGLFRYVNDKTAVGILKDIIKSPQFNKSTKAKAEYLLNKVI